MPRTTCIAIVGSREWKDTKVIADFVRSLDRRRTTLVSGGARGVDSVAYNAALCEEIPIKVYPAEWGLHGRSAGMIRNQKIVDDCDVLVAFWNGSPGTRDSIQKAYKAGKPVIIIRERKK